MSIPRWQWPLWSRQIENLYDRIRCSRAGQSVKVIYGFQGQLLIFWAEIEWPLYPSACTRFGHPRARDEWVESRCGAETVGLRIAVAAPFGWRWDFHPLESAALLRRRAVLGEKLRPVVLEIALERRCRLRSQLAW